MTTFAISPENMPLVWALAACLGIIVLSQVIHIIKTKQEKKDDDAE